MPVIDDLIDSGVIDHELVLNSGRSAEDQTYLLARTAPAMLSDEQIAQLGHQEESLRRRILVGITEFAEHERRTQLGATRPPWTF